MWITEGDESVVLKYFYPYATLKADSEDRQRGEKGVGSTFFSDAFHITCVSTVAQDTGELTSGEHATHKGAGT